MPQIGWAKQGEHKVRPYMPQTTHNAGRRLTEQGGHKVRPYMPQTAHNAGRRLTEQGGHKVRPYTSQTFGWQNLRPVPARRRGRSCVG